MLLILLFALTLGGYGEARRQLAAKALVESLSTPTAGDSALEDVRYFHAEKTAARWLAEVIREERESRGSSATWPFRSPSFLAIQLLKGFGPDAEPAVPELIGSMKTDPFDGMKAEAVGTLSRFVDSDDRVFNALVAQIRDAPEVDERWERVGQSINQALAFARKRHPALVPILIDLVETRKGRAQADAVITLSMMGPSAKSAVPALLRSLRSDDATIRAYSVRTLGRVGVADDSLRDAIRRLDHDENDFVRHEVRTALEILDYQIAVARRADELRRVIASDRALGGKPRPKAP
jgi:hypothetical protein